MTGISQPTYLCILFISFLLFFLLQSLLLCYLFGFHQSLECTGSVREFVRHCWQIKSAEMGEHLENGSFDLRISNKFLPLVFICTSDAGFCSFMRHVGEWRLGHEDSNMIFFFFATGRRQSHKSNLFNLFSFRN